MCIVQVVAGCIFLPFVADFLSTITLQQIFSLKKTQEQTDVH